MAGILDDEWYTSRVRKLQSCLYVRDFPHINVVVRNASLEAVVWCREVAWVVWLQEIEGAALCFCLTACPILVHVGSEVGRDRDFFIVSTLNCRTLASVGRTGLAIVETVTRLGIWVSSMKSPVDTSVQ